MHILLETTSCGKATRRLSVTSKTLSRWKGEDDAVVWRSYCCTVNWVVKSQVGECWGGVGEVGIGAGDVLADCGSAVWE